METEHDVLDDSSVITIPSDLEDSVDSYKNYDCIADANSGDEWEDESYFDAWTDYYEDSTYESFPLAIDETTDDSFVQAPDAMALAAGDNYMEELEENNNDPNNNMDSNEVDDSAEVQSIREESCESPMIVHRAESPKPGCSKDSMPDFPMENMENNICNNSTIKQQTERIMYLIAMINEDSIIEAVKKNPMTLASEMKIWDLIPMEGQKSYCNNWTYVPKDGTLASGQSVDRRKEAIIVSSTIKRGPADDICTVGCKKPTERDISLPKFKHKPGGGGLKLKEPITLVKRKEIPSNSQIPVPIVIPTIKTPAQSSFFANSTKQRNENAVASTSRCDTSKGAIPKTQMTNKAKAEGSKRYVTAIEIMPNNNSTVQPAIVMANKSGKVEEKKYYPLSRVPDEVIRVAQVLQREEKPLEIIVKNPVVFNSLAANVSTGVNNNQNKEQATKVNQHVQSTNRTVCTEMFYKLRTMFPNICPDYLKKLCPPEWGPGDHEAQIMPIVEYLLSKGEDLPGIAANHLNSLQSNDEKPNNNVDDVYENLIGIFPDADPHYLRDFAEANVNKPEAVKDFVELKLEKRDYPTRQQYLDRLKITEQQRQYTSAFDVKQFLEIIPDPFQYFTDRKRKTRFSTVAFEFLKSRCNKMRVTTISRVFTECHHNMSLAVQTLESLPPEMKAKRYSYEMPTEDIGLLQEIAFIKHKAEIKQYMEQIKRSEEEEFNRLKAQNALLECQCCFDSECLPSKCSTCEFGHVFCNACVLKGTNTKLGENETRIRCFADCDKEFSLSTLQRILSPTVFSILLKKRQAVEIMEAGLEGLVSCPFCHFASIPPENDKTFKCLNPECTKESCRLCKELNHLPLKCDEVVSTEKARRYIEERMTEAYARKCYNCQKTFIKEEGCNLIKCTCGAKMCYLCDAKVKDYSHFRAQGSNATNLCPLWGDTPRVDAMAVRKIAEEAQKEVLKLHPNLKIDTANLLPELPRAQAGPHTNVANAYETPRRLQKDTNIRLV